MMKNFGDPPKWGICIEKRPFSKELSKHLVHRLDCEDTMYTIFEFDDCELMQTCLSMVAPKFETFSELFLCSTSTPFV